MPTPWPRHALTLLLCACGQSPTRLEQASQQIEAQQSDADPERGRAALAALQPRTIDVPPPRPDTDLARVSLVVSPLSGALDPRTTAILEHRLAQLRLVATIESRDTTLAVTLPEAPRARVPEIAAALAAQGRLALAHFETRRRRQELRLDDPAIRWTPLLVDRVVAEASSEELPTTISIHMAPAGREALAQATGQRGYIALAFDDLVLSVPEVIDPIPSGKIALHDYAEELRDPRGALPVLAAALAIPSPAPLKVDVVAVDDFIPCADPQQCEEACTRRSGRACLRLAEARTDPEAQLATLKAACTAGDSDGCTRLCARGDHEQCQTALFALTDLRSIWSDLSHAATLTVDRCRKGDMKVCNLAVVSLILGPLGAGDFTTADHTLKSIRDESLHLQVTYFRKYLLDQARQFCEKPVGVTHGKNSCLFVAKALTEGELAPPDQAAIDDALRRADKALR